jgi:hypothetical protein
MGWFRFRKLQGCKGIPGVSVSLFSPTVLAMALLAGCGGSSGLSQQGAPQMNVHTNGLQLPASETYRVKTTPVGFVLEPASPSNQDRRDPFTVSVQLLTAQPDVTGHRVRSLDSGRALSYAATHDEEGGSSGVNWTVVAFERVGDRWIQYREDKLSEREPSELWEIAQGVRYVPSKSSAER